VSQLWHPYFSLIGEFDPDEVTRRLEIEPSWVKRIGDPGPLGATGPRSGSEWAWRPEDDDSDDVGDQLAYLAGALTLKREEVGELSKMFFGTLHVYNEVKVAARDWFSSSDTLRLIADLHVHIECKTVSSVQLEEARNDAD
jgi:hypothetical protein